MGNPASKSRWGTWLTLIAFLIGIPIAVIAALMLYFSNTAVQYHPNPQDVKSVIDSPVSSTWTGAAEQGRQAIRTVMSVQNLPGVSVAVAVDDGVRQEIVWAEGFGWADIDQKVAVTPSTRFRIGHASKAITSAGVGLLLDTGRMKLDDEVQEYVPAFPKKKWPVTVRQLMGHVAGFPHYPGEEADVPSGHCERASEGFRTFADAPLLFEPETEYRYSMYGWVLLSAAIEAAAKEPFFMFMRTKVFGPLGMSSTRDDSATESIPDRATFYFPRFSGENESGHYVARPVDYSCFAGAGAFLSTPSDLARFGMALGGRLRQGFGAQGGKFLQPDTVRLLQTPQVLATGKETEYGLGWTLEMYPLAGQSTRLASHGSRSLLGASTSFLTFPDRGLVVAVTSNTSYADARVAALEIADAFAASGLSRKK